ncbi:phage portal protein [Terribacillus saccharophilus]|uniref:phage portal protein n=1 Tax=Terribacillus saccharophilus TaxID=361277 RepID=UPI000BA79720|nr:phage portal protein [Terribacillus saccharophilus]PAF19744.1 phage portal protein [Terribacillus saccharophilus]
MYPMTPTLTEEMTKIIETGAKANEVTRADFIQMLIDKHDTLPMIEGVAYYLNDNSFIKKKEKFLIKSGVKVADVEGLKANNKISHAWHKLLVDQKTQYLVGKAMTFSSDDKQLGKNIDELADERFDDTMNELVKSASNKGVEHLHPFINEDGEFDYVIFPAEEVILIYDEKRNRDVEAALRYYPILDDKGEVVKIKAEWYTKTQVHYYESFNGEFVPDVTEPENPASHFTYNDKGFGWGRVPVIPFYNNSEAVNDLKFYKDHIDEYDKIVSGLADTFDETQELIWILKGYDGQDLDEFMTNVLYYRAIKTSEDGGVDTKSVEVPISSASQHLDRLEESIYTFGQGVNTKTDKFGNNPTGVALKFLYSLLDLKANQMERKFRAALSEFFWFYVEYLDMAGKGSYDVKSIDMTFNRTMITNEAEKAEIAQNSLGIISRETTVENHPWSKQDEMDRIKKEEDEYTRNMRPNTSTATGTSTQSSRSSSTTEEGTTETCPECNGKGKITSPTTNKTITCPTCRGDGVIAV